jgi:hypothetical protein
MDDKTYYQLLHENYEIITNDKNLHKFIRWSKKCDPEVRKLLIKYAKYEAEYLKYQTICNNAKFKYGKKSNDIIRIKRDCNSICPGSNMKLQYYAMMGGNTKYDYHSTVKYIKKCIDEKKPFDKKIAKILHYYPDIQKYYKLLVSKP